MMHTPLSAEFVTSFEALTRFAADWQRWADLGSGGIFQHWGFVQAFWSGHGPALDLRVVAVRREQRLIGLLPLQKRTSRLEFLGTPESDAGDLLCDEQDGPAVLETALRFLRREGVSVSLVNVPQDSRLMQASAALPAALRVHVQKVYRCPAPNRKLALADISNADQLHKLSRRLGRFGPVRFRHLETTSEILAHLPDFFEQHIARAAAAGRASEFANPARRTFFTALVHRMDPRNDLRFSVVFTGAKAVAYHFGFQHAGRLVYYKPSFDIDYWDFSPGDILLRSLLHYAQEAGLEEFDFSIGDEPYKRRFATDTRHAYSLHFEPSLVDPRTALRVGARALEHKVRQRPEWLSFARDMRARVSRLQRGAESRSRAREAWIYCLPGDPSSVTAKPGTLASLANLCGHHAPETSQDKLAECRRRLKAGDRFYLMQESSELAIVWTRRASRVDIPEVRRAAELPCEAIVAYECWLSSSLRRSRPAESMLSKLAEVGGGQDVWLYLLPEDRTQRDWLLAAGIAPRDHVTRRANSRRDRMAIPARQVTPQVTPRVTTESVIR